MARSEPSAERPWADSWIVLMVQALAHHFMGILEIIGESLRYTVLIFRPPVVRVFLKQVYFTGLESLPVLAVAGLAGGYLTTSQLYRVLGENLGLTLEVIRFLIVQEGSVFLVALYVLARSGSAMASELAAAKLQGEVTQLYRLGYDPTIYLITPRVWGAAMSVAALTLYVQLIIIFGGIALMALFSGWDFLLALETFLLGLDPVRGLITVFKALIFGAVVGASACHHGLSALPGPQGIPVATRTAVVHGFAGIILCDVAISLIFSR